MNIGILGTGFGAHHASIYKKLDKINSITIFGRDKIKSQMNFLNPPDSSNN